VGNSHPPATTITVDQTRHSYHNTAVACVQEMNALLLHNLKQLGECGWPTLSDAGVCSHMQPHAVTVFHCHSLTAVHFIVLLGPVSYTWQYHCTKRASLERWHQTVCGVTDTAY
jgi:hypothetical protein